MLCVHTVMWPPQRPSLSILARSEPSYLNPPPLDLLLPAGPACLSHMHSLLQKWRPLGERGCLIYNIPAQQALGLGPPTSASCPASTAHPPCGQQANRHGVLTGQNLLPPPVTRLLKSGSSVGKERKSPAWERQGHLPGLPKFPTPPSNSPPKGAREPGWH